MTTSEVLYCSECEKECWCKKYNICFKCRKEIKLNEKMSFKVVVDEGKPYEEEFKNEKQVLDYLKKLKEDFKNNEDKPHTDIFIYDSLNKDVSDYFFKDLKGGLK